MPYKRRPMLRATLAAVLSIVAGGLSVTVGADQLSDDNDVAKSVTPTEDDIAKIIAGSSKPDSDPEADDDRQHLAAICDTAVVTSVPQVTATRVAGWAAQKKSEYETTDAYLKRSAKWFGDGKIIASVAVGSGEYDADRQELTIPVSFLTMPVMDEKLTASYEFLAIEDSKKSLGSYVGQNAYGVKTRVRRYMETQFGVAWEAESFEITGSNTSKTFPVAAADAPSVRKHLRFLIAGEAAPPYVFIGIGGHGPYLTNPVDLTTYSFGIVAKPACAAIYDASNKRVLSSWVVKGEEAVQSR